MRLFIRLIVIVILYLFLSGLSFEQNKIYFENVSVDKGLSHSTVYSITQDKYGFLWIGTQDGINKFDGYEFTSFNHDPNDTSSLSNSSVSVVYNDSKGNLWIGTWGGGLNRLDNQTGNFIHYYNSKNVNSIPALRISYIIESRKGELWIGTGDNGLYKYDYTTKKFFGFNVANSSLAGNRVWSIAEDLEGNLWVGTDYGLNKFDLSKGTFTLFKHDSNVKGTLNSDTVRFVYVDKKGTIWAGTNKGLDKLNLTTGKFRSFVRNDSVAGNLSENIINTIFEDDSANLWVGTFGGGLNLLDKKIGKFKVYKNVSTDPSSISNNDVRCIFQDNSGNVWVGTRGGGLDKFNLKREPFVHIKYLPFNPNSLSDKNIRALYEDKNGDLWIGTSESGLNKYETETGKVIRFENNGNPNATVIGERVMAITQDYNGIFWIGSNKGLTRYDSQKRRFTQFTYNPVDPNSLSSNEIISIAEDDFGNLWIGTYGRGVNKLNISTSKCERFFSDPADPNSLGGNEVYAITKDKLGNMWVGTSNGLNKIDPKTDDIKLFRHESNNPKSLSSNTVYSLAENNRGIWIGTSVGFDLYDLEKESFKSYTEKDGLSNNFVYGIAVDNQNRIWLSTNKGISCFNPSDKSFRSYNIYDGLQSNIFNVGSYYKGRSGKIYFGGINGVTVFDPSKIQINTQVPTVAITKFQLFNRAKGVGDSLIYVGSLSNNDVLQLNHNQNFFTIEFAALDFVNPMKNQYMYKMEGVDLNWIKAGTQRSATYTNLDPGDYIFMVRASNNDGVWSDIGLNKKIQIAPPFWRTLWFIGLSSVVILVIAFGFYNWRINDLTNRHKELEKYIHEKEIVEKELIATQERYELAVKGSTDGIWDWDIVTDEVYLSPQWKHLIGYEDSEILNKMSSFEDRLHPYDKPGTQSTINDFVLREGKFDTEFRLLKKDNSYGWFRVRGTAVRDETGKALRMSGVMTDVSIRKNAEHTLRESKLRIQQILDNSLDAVITADDKGYVTIWNEQAEKMFGWKKDEAIGRSVVELIVPPQYRDSHSAGMKRFLSTGETKMMNRRVEITAVNKYGNELPVELTITPIVTSDGISFSAFIRDITVRKKTEEQLRNNEDLFQIITSGVSDLIVILDLEGKRIYASDSYRKFFGEESFRFGADSFAEIHPDDRERIREIFRKTIEKKQGQRAEYRFLLKDGSIRFIESDGNIIFDENGEPYRVVVVSRDITDYKKAEEEIRNLNKDLERRIHERTSELEETNQNLQTQIAVSEKIELVQNALYLISEAIHKSPDLQSLFEELHGIVGKLMSAENFYIALYDPKTDLISFPYRVDQFNEVTLPRKFGKGMTEYLIKTGKPLLAKLHEIQELHREGKVDKIGKPALIWLGVPLVINKRAMGALAVQNYNNESAYGEDEKQILAYISEQVAFAIEKKRNEEDERKRIELVLKNRNALIELAQIDMGDFNNALSIILETTASAIDIERVGFWKIERETESLKCEMLYIKSKDSIDDNSSKIVLPAAFPSRAHNLETYLDVLKANRVLITYNAQEDTSSKVADEYLKPLGITSMIDVPVWFQGDIVGIVCLEHVGESREFILEVEDFVASIANMVSLAMETSNRRIVEEYLKTSERQYKLLIDNANDAIIVAQDGMIRFANPRAVGITGFSFDELSSKNFIEFIHPDDRKHVMENYIKRMDNAEVETGYEFRVVCKDDSIRIVELNAVLISWQGKPATLNFLSDVTERKRAEEEIQRSLEKERELSELRSRFISMTSHEFRTPLTSIMSSAEIIEKYFDKLDDEQRAKNLHRIQDNVKHMTQLLSDVLFIGKTEAKKLQLDKQPVDLRQLCRNIVEQFEINLLQRTKHRIIFVEKNLSDIVSIDSKMIRQILDNLISNAIKYSPDGSMVYFEAGCTEDKIFFIIKDNGLGIPTEDQKRLFEPFQRAANVSAISGTGLGLAIVKNSVELHGGTIKVESELGEGTTFIVELPKV